MPYNHKTSVTLTVIQLYLKKCFRFLSCIKESISKSVGCKLPWDTTTRNIPTCQNIEQFRCNIYVLIKILLLFREFSREYESLGYMVPAQVEEKTGCRMPCVYNEFRFFGSPLVTLKKEYLPILFQGTHYDGFGLILWNTSPYITMETEELIYPFPSLVSFIPFASSMYYPFASYPFTLVQIF